jgi:hypothetical protein
LACSSLNIERGATLRRPVVHAQPVLGPREKAPLAAV